MFYTYLTIFSILAISSIIFFVKKHGRGKVSNDMFFFMMLPAVLWLTCANLTNTAPSISLRFFFAQLGMIGPLLFGPIFLYFCLNFPSDSKIRDTKLILKLSLPIIPLLFLVPTHFNIESLIINQQGVTQYEPGILFYILDALLLAYIGGGLWHIKRTYKQKNSFEQKQVRWFSASIIIMVGLGLITNSLLPVIFSYSKGSIWGPPVGVLIFTIISAYTIMRFRLMKIHITLHRTIFLRMCFVILTIMMSSIILLAHNIFGGGIAFMFSILFLVCAPWIHKRIAASVMNTFPIENIDFAEFFDLNKYRISISYLEPFLEKTKLLIRNEFGAESSILIVATDGKRFFELHKGTETKNSLNKAVRNSIQGKGDGVFTVAELDAIKSSRHTKKLLKNNIAIVAPVHADKVKGVLLIHNKPFGKSFTAEEKNQLSDLAHSVALTIEQIQTFERSCLGVEITKHRLDTGVISSKK